MIHFLVARIEYLQSFALGAEPDVPIALRTFPFGKRVVLASQYELVFHGAFPMYP